MKYTKYVIYQLKNIENCNYSFMEWEFAKHHFKMDDYKKVYEDDVKENIDDFDLESLYRLFNTDKPLDFKGHSLSVSDVVELVDNNLKSELYYCDFFGW